MKLSLHGDWIMHGGVVLQDWRLLSAVVTGRIRLLELGMIASNTKQFTFESVKKRANQMSFLQVKERTKR